MLAKRQLDVMAVMVVHSNVNIVLSGLSGELEIKELNGKRNVAIYFT